jgi:hypothetical protein
LQLPSKTEQATVSCLMLVNLITMTQDFFIQKQEMLNKAHARVKNLIEKYKKDLRQKPEDPSFEDKNGWDFNLLHDLEYRMEQRLWDNWSAHKDWCWDNVGLNIYSL